MDAIDKLAKLWDVGDDEDRQGMARSLFSYVVYDLDTRRIVGFRLKPWADRFLVLRSALYEDDETSKNGSPSGIKPQAEDMAPEGFEDSSSASIEKAVQRLLRLLYAGMELPSVPLTDFIPPKEDRNREIYRRYIEGARAVDLAAEYGISLQRVYVIIRMGTRNQW